MGHTLDLLPFVRYSLALRYLIDAQPLCVFLTGGIAIAVLADWIRRAAERVAPRRRSIDFKFICEFRIIECLYLVLPSMPTQNFKERGP